MKKHTIILMAVACLLAVTAISAPARDTVPADRSEVRSGNRDFRKKKYKEADIDYRRALVKDSTSVAANYNLANNLFRQEEYQEAAKFIDVAEGAENADVFYNKGCIALKNQDYNTAMEAFRQSLLLRPDDVGAKENFVYAREMAREQENQQQQNQQQNRDRQDKQQNQDRRQQDQNKDQQDKNQDQNRNQQDNQQNQDRQNQGQDNQDQSQQPQLTPQAAQQMLQAIEAKEKETQEKVKKEEAMRLKSRQKDKNW